MNLQFCLTSFAHKVWQSKGVVSTCLLPLSLIVKGVAQRKQRRFQTQAELAWRAPVPVVVVGNIFVGGTGKTPVVIALAHALRAQGWNPGVISRGYGVRTGAAPLVLPVSPDPSQVGDEPALIARATAAPVAVHPRRKLAAQALLQANPEVDVLISDDGLQHLELSRNLEIVVQDERGIGNGRLLPAGPLREPADRLTSVDYLLTQRLRLPPQGTPPTTGFRPIAIDMSMCPSRVIHLVSGTELSWNAWVQAHASQRPSAAAAIGNPARFFDMLKLSGLAPAAVMPLPDHYDYRESPFGMLGEAPILITPKDAVKCRHLQDNRLWAVQTETQFSDPGWLNDVHRRLQALPPAQNRRPDENQ